MEYRKSEFWWFEKIDGTYWNLHNLVQGVIYVVVAVLLTAGFHALGLL